MVGYKVVVAEMPFGQAARVVSVVLVVLMVLAGVQKNILDKVHQALLCIDFVRC